MLSPVGSPRAQPLKLHATRSSENNNNVDEDEVEASLDQSMRGGKPAPSPIVIAPFHAAPGAGMLPSAPWAHLSAAALQHLKAAENARAQQSKEQPQPSPLVT